MPDETRVGIIGTGAYTTSTTRRSSQAPLAPTESETITDAHPAAQNPIESFSEPQHGFAANQGSSGYIPLDTSPTVRQDDRLGSVDVPNRRHIELDAGSLSRQSRAAPVPGTCETGGFRSGSVR